MADTPTNHAVSAASALAVNGVGSRAGHDEASTPVVQDGQGVSTIPGAVVKVDNAWYFDCPHCGTTIEVVDVACSIFRCGTMKSGKGQTPIPPHTDQATCERLYRDGKVWGCARPFRFDGQQVTICGYI